MTISDPQPQTTDSQPPGPQPRRRPWAVIILAAVCVLLAGIVIGFLVNGAQGGGSKPAAARTTAVAEPTLTDTPPTDDPATSTNTAPVTTLFTQSGNGQAQTKPFTTQPMWGINYQYDCGGDKGNFAVSSYDTSGMLEDVVVNELQVSGSSNAIVNADPGTHFLKILSECSWTITVVG